MSAKSKEMASLVETAKHMDISVFVKNERLKAAGLIAGAPAKRNPRIIIYDVPRAEDDNATLADIIDQNLSESEKPKFRQQVRLAFKTGNKSRDTCNWILDVSKEARDLLFKKERIYVGWSCCKIHDYVAATRCYKCQAFGHTSKYCKTDKDICGRCANSGHTYNNCPEKSNVSVCANCKKSGKNSDHCVTRQGMPSLHLRLKYHFITN